MSTARKQEKRREKRREKRKEKRMFLKVRGLDFETYP
jgi:hypothetical protein